MNTSCKVYALGAALTVAFALSACGSHTSDEKASQKSAAHKDEDGHDHKAEKGQKTSGAIKVSDEEIARAGIRVEEVSEQEIADTLSVTATIQANQEKLAHVSPRVPGRLVAVHAKLGDRVRASQALAVLDSIDVGEAQSAYRQAQTEARVAGAAGDRAEKLFAEQIISQRDYLRTKADQEKSLAALRSAEAKLRLLGVAPSKGDAQGSTFAVTAPFAGTVIRKDAVLGELAQPDKSLFVIADLSNLWIEADIGEKDLFRVSVGAPAVVTVSGYPKDVFKGRVTYVSPVMEKETRTVRARIEVPNADSRLRPEMFASAVINTSSKRKAMSLPETAVVLIQGQQTVFIEEADGFVPRAIELGEKLQGRFTVNAGLKNGEMVVAEGAYALKARMLKSQLGEGHAH